MRKGVRFLYNGTQTTKRRQRRKHTMNTETVLARILPAIEELIKEVVSQVVGSSTPATLYDLEERTQAVLPQIGQVLLQGLVTAQGAGVVGPTRPCPCGADQP